MTVANVVFGTGSFTSQVGYQSSEDLKEILSAIQEQGIKTLDTSAIYGESEQYLGEVSASNWFTIDTKLPGFAAPEPSTKDLVIATGKESLKKLNTTQVDVYYIHGPDTRVSFEETLEGIHTLYQIGTFKRFGLSNFSPDQLNEVIRICQERNYIPPTVYQGNYNAIARRPETDLFPILRDHNISFYAYSPSAGGFLTKTPEELKKGGGRWDRETFAGKVYNYLYTDRPLTLSALGKWHEIADVEGISAVEMAYRWVAHNSILDGRKGDSVIIGARNPSQVRGTMEAIRKGPLSVEAQGKIDAIWETLEPESFLDNLSGYFLSRGVSAGFVQGDPS